MDGGWYAANGAPVDPERHFDTDGRRPFSTGHRRRRGRLGTRDPSVFEATAGGLQAGGHARVLVHIRRSNAGALTTPGDFDAYVRRGGRGLRDARRDRRARSRSRQLANRARAPAARDQGASRVGACTHRRGAGAGRRRLRSRVPGARRPAGAPRTAPRTRAARSRRRRTRGACGARSGPGPRVVGARPGCRLGGWPRPTVARRQRAAADARGRGCAEAGLAPPRWCPGAWYRHRARVRDAGRRDPGLARRGRRRSGRRRRRCERALDGPRRDLGGRADRDRRDGAVAAAAPAPSAPRERRTRFVLGPLDAGGRRSRPPRGTGPTRCPGACCALDPSVDGARAHPLGAHRNGRRDLVATAPAASKCPRRRRKCVRRPTSAKRSSAGSTAAPSTRRWVSPAISPLASSAGPALSPASTRRLDRAARPARRGRRVAPLGVRVAGPTRRVSSPIERSDRRRPGPSARDLEDELPGSNAWCRALLRPGGMRRGQVVLSTDEAWDLMAATGPRLAAAGFDVRVPAMSRRRSHAVAARVRRRNGIGRRRQPARERPVVGACSTTSS